VEINELFRSEERAMAKKERIVKCSAENWPPIAGVGRPVLIGRAQPQ
jgi:hypothetical protein